ncbi:unnamed protein product, partial [Meganyctiphanes norvegica]
MVAEADVRSLKSCEVQNFATKVKKELGTPVKAKFNIRVCPSVAAKLESGDEKARHHPGKINVGYVKLPEKLTQAAAKVLEGYPEKTISTDATKLSKYVYSRHTPLEQQEHEEKVKDIIDFVISQETLDPMTIGIDDNLKKTLLDRRENKIKTKIKQEIYNWENINYNEYMSAVYMVGRLAPDYAALMRIFKEIQKRDNKFTPQTFFDFGSGVGSGMWMIADIRTLYLRMSCYTDCIGKSMREKLTQKGKLHILQNGPSGGNFFKQFLPSSEMLKYDIVLSSRTLFELPDMASRLRTIDILWRKTGGYLVLVEAGTNEGYRLLLEARDYILEMSFRAKEHGESHAEGYVFAPCPHDYFCPRYLDGSYTPCNFEVSYEPLKLAGRKVHPKMEKFSYVVLKRGTRQDDTIESWPRVIRKPLHGKGHVICRTCTKFGQLQEFTLTKRRHGKHLYQVSKRTDWGDLLPVEVPKPEPNSTAEQQNHLDTSPLETED